MHSTLLYIEIELGENNWSRRGDSNPGPPGFYQAPRDTADTPSSTGLNPCRACGDPSGLPLQPGALPLSYGGTSLQEIELQYACKGFYLL